MIACRYHVLALGICLVAPIGTFAEDVDFNRDVLPLLTDRCFTCHGPDAEHRKATLRLDRSGGEDGAYRTKDGVAGIVPGSAEKSAIWKRVTSSKSDEVMPPPDSEKTPLSAKERSLLKRWIDSGAKYERYWAFAALESPSLPNVSDRNWSQLPIDLHVLKRLEEAGLKPSSSATKRTLIRRATFDLIGLPPTREEIHAFLADESATAYETVVDRLLSTPHYGEHMARYWLDLVRFADTNGMHKDFFRSTSPYRDWVIDAFNSNLGYDEFLRYQLAGDLFEKPTDEQLIASGFHRLHLIIDRGTALPEESFFKNVVDRVTAVGTAFLGMSVHCASCHDHKYDPITQKDFYSLFAFFNNIDAAPETNGGERGGLQPPFVTVPTREQQLALADLDQRFEDLEAKRQAALRGSKASKDAKQKVHLAQEAERLAGEKKKAEESRKQFQKSARKAMVMRERKDVRPTHLRIRGEYDKPGPLVTRNTPGFLPPLKKRGDVANRMDLAEWFVAADNPLTSRVAVNRIWQQFFGVGLVKTSEDLGRQGEVPSHPELLNYLAASFVKSGWDVKALVRQIVLSKTYRQSSRANPQAFEKDPENRYFSAVDFSKALTAFLEPAPVWIGEQGKPVPQTEWILSKKIGEGSVGEVWLARNSELTEKRVFKNRHF
ncbi:MAG: DUF1549 domain-containing protein [Planctomycetota bacterium]